MLTTVRGAELGLRSPGSLAGAGRAQARCEAPFPESPPGGARGSRQLRALAPSAARRPAPRRENPTRPPRGGGGWCVFLSWSACQGPSAEMMEEEEGAEEQQRFSHRQVQENGVLAGLGKDGVEILRGNRRRLSPASSSYRGPRSEAELGRLWRLRLS